MTQSRLVTPIGQTAFVLSSAVMLSALGSFATQAAETSYSSNQADTQALALGLDDRSDLKKGSHLCVNNGDPICGNPVLYTSPWTLVEDDDHFTPDGFRGEFYDGVESGTGPTAAQQAALSQALDDYNEYLESTNTAACIHNSSVHCD